MSAALERHEDLASVLAHVEERVPSKKLTFQFGADLFRVVGERACTPGRRPGHFSLGDAGHYGVGLTP